MTSIHLRITLGYSNFLRVWSYSEYTFFSLQISFLFSTIFQPWVFWQKLQQTPPLQTFSTSRFYDTDLILFFFNKTGFDLFFRSRSNSAWHKVEPSWTIKPAAPVFNMCKNSPLLLYTQTAYTCSPSGPSPIKSDDQKLLVLERCRLDLFTFLECFASFTRQATI